VNFKDLTPKNFTEPDKASAVYVRPSPEGGTEPWTGEDWARVFLSVVLSEHVPEHVRDLFAVARAAMIYGWFYSPFYALGDEQLRRVADTACLYRYQALGGLPKKSRKRSTDDDEEEWPSFYARIKFLVKAGVIPAEREELWDGFRELRNLGSHPTFQTLQPPGLTANSLAVVAEHVNALFAP
jgi:hypothetical protein